MFDISTITAIIDSLISGGPHGIIAILVLIIVGLLADRRRLVHENAKKEEKIDKIIDEYYQGNITLAEALNSLKTVLYEIKEHF